MNIEIELPENAVIAPKWLTWAAYQWGYGYLSKRELAKKFDYSQDVINNQLFLFTYGILSPEDRKYLDGRKDKRVLLRYYFERRPVPPEPKLTPPEPKQKKSNPKRSGPLTEREKEIWSLRNEQNKTLQEIGDIYGLSREAVRQILVKLQNTLDWRMTIIHRRAQFGHIQDPDDGSYRGVWLTFTEPVDIPQLDVLEE